MRSITKSDPFRLLRQVNLNHLLYFWAVGQTGSVTAAAARLGISQPGVTKQLRLLEHRLGARLFEREARGVRLTEHGLVAMRYAEEVIGVCTELVRNVPLQGAKTQRPITAGTADGVPKIVIRALLQPLMAGPDSPRVVCKEWRIDHLLSELSLHRLDLVISDSPLPESGQHSLSSFTAMSSPVDLYAAPRVARKFKKGFPGSLANAPMLMPAEGTSPRAALDRWFALHRTRPRIAAEAEDRSLLHHFAESELGIVPVASITAADVMRQFGLVRIGSLPNVREEYYLITVARQNEHPALSKLRKDLAESALRRRSRR
ncbi:Transcriptional activator protein NhaR [Caulifigura coniformis]|uniref:Transcriptional activator protein NhaR n=1 Tax=Caulifigura coniformis TaxID=2527983 RepID=A0A517SLK7_9PLAN|nr:LysR family transcriptional regulator [Caulifigura coniformis]QDT57001.1 Transcriptional activator protein NhaR [Caulifigura coniformis]